jgi:hypothetical protein
MTLAVSKVSFVGWVYVAELAQEVWIRVTPWRIQNPSLEINPKFEKGFLGFVIY